MIKKLTSYEYGKLIRLSFGTILAILIADLLHLQYAMSAGILALLTIQDTKKETVIVSLKRIMIFFLMTLFSLLILPIAGYTVWGFALILVPYLYCCLLFSMKEAIAPIAVLCTHYISSKSCSAAMIKNEFMILIIGAGIGILLNLFLSSHLEEIHRYQESIDDAFRKILARMSVYILAQNKESYTDACFHELDGLLSSLKIKSLQYQNNHFIGSNDYFYHYVQMRISQCELLKQIYQDILTLHTIPNQTLPLSKLLKKISMELSEINDANGLLASIEEMRQKMQTEPMPATRKEFETRAVLFHILMDLTLFVTIKKTFADSLSEEEKEKYWNKNATSACP